MQIEEWRPPPPSAPLPPPPRKYRQGIVLTVLFVVSFVVSLAVLNWHNLTSPTTQEVVTTEPLAAPEAASSTEAPVPPPQPAHEVSAEAARNIRGVAECIASGALTSGDREQVIAAMLDRARAAEPAVMTAFESGTVSPQAVTTVQASGFMGMLNQMQGPLAEKARQGFQQGIEDGTCKIAPPVFTQDAAPPSAS